MRMRTQLAALPIELRHHPVVLAEQARRASGRSPSSRATMPSPASTFAITSADLRSTPSARK
jgi:hypothetical protein